jgi:hypothetical protein
MDVYLHPRKEAKISKKSVTTDKQQASTSGGFFNRNFLSQVIGNMPALRGALVLFSRSGIKRFLGSA